MNPIKATLLIAATFGCLGGKLQAITGSWFFTGAQFEGNVSSPQVTRLNGTVSITQSGPNYTLAFQFPGTARSVTVPLTVSGTDYRGDLQLSISPDDIMRSVVVRDHGNDVLTVNWVDAGYEQESPYGGLPDMQKFSTVSGALTKAAAPVPDVNSWKGQWNYNGHLFEADDAGEILIEDFSEQFEVTQTAPDAFNFDNEPTGITNGELHRKSVVSTKQTDYEDEFYLSESTGEMDDVTAVQLGGGRAVLLWFGQGTQQLTVKPSDLELGSGPYPSIQYAYAEVGLMIQSSSLAGPPGDAVTDTDSDGVSDLLEYAFNLNSTRSDRRILTEGTGTSGLPIARLDTTTSPARLRIEYLRRKNSASGGISYQVEWSSNLGSWSTGAATTMVTSIDGAWERVVVSDPFPAPTRFSRVSVSLDRP